MEKSSLQITKNDSNYIIILNKPPNEGYAVLKMNQSGVSFVFIVLSAFYLRMIRWSGNMMFNNCHVRVRKDRHVWILYR